MKQIILNGNKLEIKTPLTALAMLEELGFEKKFVAVAINRKCILKKEFPTAIIKNGDEVEVLSPTAGG